MNTLWLVVRTVFLIFIAGYTIVIDPASIWGAGTATVTIDILRRVNRAAWLAIGWIAIETAYGWIAFKIRRSRERRAAEPAAGGAAPQP